MDYYKRYMGDYQRDTGDLSLAQHGAYTVLLDHYYSVRKPLPEAMEKLHRLCRATTEAEQDAVASIVDQFFPIGADGLRHNDRADEEIAKWEAFAEENREKGKLGGRPKKNPNGNPSGNQMDKPKETRRETRGLQNPPVLETREKPSPTPTPNPIQNPNPKPVRDSNARASNEGVVTHRSEVAHAGAALDSFEYEQAIMAKYPKGPNPPNWQGALLHARALVDAGLSTWPDLVAVTERYAAYTASGSQSVNIAAHNFFDRRKGDYWQQAWDVVAPNGASRNGRKTYDDYSRESAERLASLPGEDPGPL